MVIICIAQYISGMHNSGVVYIYMHRQKYHEQDNTREYAEPGGRLNKKDGLTRYGDSHVKDKTS